MSPVLFSAAWSYLPPHLSEIRQALSLLRDVGCTDQQRALPKEATYLMFTDLMFTDLMFTHLMFTHLMFTYLMSTHLMFTYLLDVYRLDVYTFDVYTLDVYTLDVTLNRYYLHKISMYVKKVIMV